MRQPVALHAASDVRVARHRQPQLIVADWTCQSLDPCSGCLEIGSQGWAKVYDGRITNGGVNIPPLS